jgi:hypothetical protein
LVRADEVDLDSHNLALAWARLLARAAALAPGPLAQSEWATAGAAVRAGLARAGRSCAPPPPGAERAGLGVSGWRAEGRARVASLLHRELLRLAPLLPGGAEAGQASGPPDAGPCGAEGLLLALRPGDEAAALNLLGPPRPAPRAPLPSHPSAPTHAHPPRPSQALYPGPRTSGGGGGARASPPPRASAER